MPSIEPRVHRVARHGSSALGVAQAVKPRAQRAARPILRIVARPLNMLLIAQLVATCFMTGLIWCIQIVHYPLMAAVGKSDFSSYEHQHQNRISWIVGPMMSIELILAVASVGTITTEKQPLMILGLILLVVIWLSTAVLQMPAHRKLSIKFSVDVHSKLVSTNWIRTIAWTLRTAVLVFALLT